MPRYTLLLIDPNRTQRDAFTKQLSLRFQVTAVPDTKTALEVIGTIQPQAVVASLRQDNGHGLQLCKTLREKTPQNTPYFVVHGHPGGEKTPDREAMQKKWTVDVYLSQATVDTIEPLVWHEMARREKEKRLSDPVRTSGSQFVVPENSTPPARPPATRTTQENLSGWQKLLKSEITLKTIKEALNK